jgi:ABC-type nickel/cobalt efflux system permease component RcnA
MITVLSLTLLGFFLGMRHATDPDHVVAVTTIVTRQPTIRSALIIGSLWGVGHTLTIVAVGAAIVIFAIVIPPRLGLSMEMAVALMLIVLGMWNLSGFLDQLRRIRLVAAGPAHSHGFLLHSHAPIGPPASGGPGDHTHAEAPVVAWLDWRLGGLTTYQALRPLAVGLVHGLAGSAAVALLVLAVIKNPWWAMAYLVLFGVGTIAGMMLITGAIGAALAFASRRSWRLDILRTASGLLSIGFGLFMVYQIIVVDGLITGNPTADMLQ